MRLVGYIKEIKYNSFAIPIYSDGFGKYYCHNLNSFFRIIEFDEIIIDETKLKPVYLYKDFSKDSIGAVVFIGEGHVFYNSVSDVIKDIRYYLDQTTHRDEYKYIKEEVLELEKIIGLNNLKDQVETKSVRDLGVIRPQFMHGGSYMSGIIRYPLHSYLKKENEILNEDNIFMNMDQTFNTHSYNEILIEIVKKFVDTLDAINAVQFTSHSIDNKEDDNYSIVLYESIEELLKSRADIRRQKMKDFNYFFHSNVQNRENAIEKMVDNIFRNKEST